MITDFQNIPAVFIERYRPWLEMWGKRFSRWGATCFFPLIPYPQGRVLVDIPPLDAYGNVPFIVVGLSATQVGSQMVVKPCSDRDADLIRRHCAALLQ